MFRKVFLSGAMLLGLGFGVFGDNWAQARDRDDRRDDRHDWRGRDDRRDWRDRDDRHDWREVTKFKVFYTRGFRGDYRLYGVFDSDWQARKALERLRCDGFSAYISEFRERC